MALKKYKLGQLIELYDEKNSKNEFTSKSDIQGVNNKKQFQDYRATTADMELQTYRICRTGMFACNKATSRNGNKISIALRCGKDCLVSPSYYCFKVIREDIILPEYLNIWFSRPSFDSYAITNSWGSATEFFSWDEMCNIDIELPSIEIQQKYVNVYKAMVANQKTYEKGLDDLKLVCDAYIENLRKTTPCEEIGTYIEKVDKRNTDKLLNIEDVKSINKDGTFARTVANVDVTRIHTYKIVHPNEFAYTNRINIGSIARRLEKDKACLVSASYDVFRIVNTEKLLPEYLTLWLRRTEFFRSTGFYAIGSVKDSFTVEMMGEVKIPIPAMEIQKSIAAIYEVYLKRKEINEKLKSQIKDLCPILITGAVQEAKKEK